MLCLQNLLRHPELSNSQLLADFLSPYSTETQFLDKMLPDVNLGAEMFSYAYAHLLCWVSMLLSDSLSAYKWHLSLAFYKIYER